MQILLVQLPLRRSKIFKQYRENLEEKGGLGGSKNNANDVIINKTCLVGKHDVMIMLGLFAGVKSILLLKWYFTLAQRTQEDKF